ncbi:sodium pump decarboxylases, gamma subunit [Selenomonas sp. GACV-9]|uniref:OadG family protein n=1 Tax=Selenomonas sp. GACV-9 TaxID=3158782 RepID=UPI0008E93019|nr:sodium pump decarboxylases, gamma subunit [Selenomonas ruminantium]
MSHPVTTNPLIIMLINMTVVFLVLTVLGLVINLIHIIDPTKPKAVKQEESAPAEPEAAPAVSAPATETAAVEEGISPEVIAVIAAAIASYGYGMEQVRAIRPIPRDAWKNSGRAQLAKR